MRRWQLTILSIVIVFVVVVVGVIGKGGSSQAAFSAGKNATKPVLIAQNSYPTRIMLLGDSITAGHENQNGYRRLLWFYLRNAGYNVDFVGSTQFNCNGRTPLSDFDLEHEGHCGWRADQMLERIDEWASRNQPDIVLIHVGTIDLALEPSAESTIEDVRGIIQKFCNNNPYVKILLAQIIGCGYPERIQQFNSLIPNLASETYTSQSPVIVVDQYNGFDATLGVDTFDGCHPNDTGEWKLATRWFDALKQVL
ncbi:SGNH/GDSL hydrolase family protein [Scytonema sp. PCC 10023]|uniref:SGNH/GDSL hydrolase family protein n=1 Tax=Scytonema sp. PCC 10023 TaxID=1680591 RepID=UPI0039C63291